MQITDATTVEACVTALGALATNPITPLANTSESYLCADFTNAVVGVTAPTVMWNTNGSCTKKTGDNCTTTQCPVGDACIETKCAPGQCGIKADCAAVTDKNVCNPADHMCVQCLTNADCPIGACRESDFTCVGCRAHGDCPGGFQCANDECKQTSCEHGKKDSKMVCPDGSFCTQGNKCSAQGFTIKVIATSGAPLTGKPDDAAAEQISQATAAALNSVEACVGWVNPSAWIHGKKPKQHTAVVKINEACNTAIADVKAAIEKAFQDASKPAPTPPATNVAYATAADTTNTISATVDQSNLSSFSDCTNPDGTISCNLSGCTTVKCNVGAACTTNTECGAGKCVDNVCTASGSSLASTFMAVGAAAIAAIALF